MIITNVSLSSLSTIAKEVGKGGNRMYPEFTTRLFQESFILERVAMGVKIPSCGDTLLNEGFASKSSRYPPWLGKDGNRHPQVVRAGHDSGGLRKPAPVFPPEMAGKRGLAPVLFGACSPFLLPWAIVFSPFGANDSRHSFSWFV